MKTKRKLLIALFILTVIMSMMATPVMAKSKSHKKSSNNTSTGLITWSPKSTKLEEEHLILEVERDVGDIIPLDGKKNQYALCIGTYAFLMDRTEKDFLIHFYPSGEAADDVPGRGFIEREYPYYIGGWHKSRTSVGVYGYFYPPRVRKHRNGWTEYKFTTCRGQGFRCKAKTEKKTVKKGKKTKTIKVLHIVFYDWF